ncbi:TolC family outer membrane protein [Curvivirga aplysinae]|uniref:TolC family outer membrane protein n=1 Tax=Curvivirga aplysinae TaxID=2529852 RepID=UPI001C3F7D3D|nr:TolC family outer membrane protein [Curvivirga aplysinae]
MNIKAFLKLGVAAAGLATATLSSGAAWSASLEEALLAAYDNNPTLLAQRASLRVTNEGVAQAVSGWRPTVTGTGSLGAINSDTDNNGVDTDSDRSFYSAALSVTQNLYAGGGTEAGIASAEASVLSARASLAATEQSILLEAATAYLDVLRDIAVLDLNQQNEKRLQKQLEATQDRFDVGEVTRTDVAQAESRLSRARADTISAAGSLETSKANYEQIVGEPIDGQMATPVLNLGLPLSREEAITLSSDKNPLVVAARHSYDASVMDVDSAEASLYPSLDLVGATNYNNDVSGEDLTTKDASIRLNLSVPIYQQGLVSSQVRQAKESASLARVQIEEQRRSVIETATSSWENLKTTRAQIEAQQDEVRATTIAFEGVEQEAIVGSRTVLDVLDAEQELLDAKVSLVRSQRDENVAQFALLAAIGGLTMSELGLGADIYDATAHYDDVRDKWWGIGPDIEKDAPAE